MTAAGGVPQGADRTPSEMRGAFLRLAQAVDCGDEPIGGIENRRCAAPGGALVVRVYTPVSADAGPLPALIFFHGGACVFGNLDSHDGLCRVLANAARCRVLSVDYRLAPEHKFPAAVDDCFAATRWAVDNASALSIDSRRIAIAGDSSGGGLATVVCQLARRAGGPDLALQLLLCPVLDLSTESPSRREFAQGYFFDRATLQWSLSHYCTPATDLADPRLSPLRAAEFAGLPPAHIHTAEFDPFRDEGKAYADELRRAGVDVQHTCHAGMIHHFYGMGAVVPYARAAVRSAGAAVLRALAGH